MNTQERALRIQIESYRKMVDDLSLRMAEQAEKHIVELAQCAAVKTDLEARLEEVSAASVRAVKMYQDANASLEEVKAKIGVHTVDNRNLRKELDESQETSHRRFIISKYLFRAASRGLETISLPQHPAASPSSSRQRLELDLSSFDEHLDYISEMFGDVSIEQLNELLGETPVKTAKAKKGK